MTEPARQTSLDLLWPGFREPFERYLAQIRATFPQFDIRVTETRRTQARQDYLYSIGRTREPMGKIVTHTRNSMHQYGLATDIALIRKRTGQAEWSWKVWESLYRQVPLDPYGLEKLDWEMPHIQIQNTKRLVLQAKQLGIVKT